MSSQSRLEPKFNEEVSLDEYILVTIVKSLNNAMDYLADYDFAHCVSELDKAWLGSVQRVRIEVGNQFPSDIIEERKKAVPSIAQIEKRADWLRQVDQLDFERVAATDGSYANERTIQAIAYQEAQVFKILRDVLRNEYLQIATELEKMGLWIGKRGHIIVPTADRKPEEKLPLLTKLGPSIPRKTG